MDTFERSLHYRPNITLVHIGSALRGSGLTNHTVPYCRIIFNSNLHELHCEATILLAIQRRRRQLKVFY